MHLACHIAASYPAFFLLLSAILFLIILLIAAAIIMQRKSYKMSTLSINFVVKLNFIRPSFCSCNPRSTRCQITSQNITFIDVIGALYHIASNQNRNAVFIWSVDAWFIFIEQITVIFIDPFTIHLVCYCIMNERMKPIHLWRLQTS